MKRLTPDGWLLGITATVCLGTVIWVALGERKIAAQRGDDRLMVGAFGEMPNLTLRMPGATGEPPAWSSPPGDPADEGWVFDLFTPPEIYYNRESGRFTVRSGPAAPDPRPQLADPAEGLAEFELIEVRQDPYPVQLVGYAGGPDARFWGIFENLETGESQLARRGDTVRGTAMILRELEVRREEMIVPDSMPLREIVAVGEVWDPSARDTVRLSSAEVRLAEQPWATINFAWEGEHRTVHVGDEIDVHDGTVEVVAMNRVPATVTLVRRDQNGALIGTEVLRTASLNPNFTQNDANLFAPIR